MDREFYKELKNTSKDKTDRYKNCQLLEDTESGDVLIATREIDSVPYRSSDVYHRVKSHEVCRLDILAHMYYQNPLLWWVIAQANNIYDPFTPLSPGTLLRIPGLETLYGNNGVLL